MTVNNNYNIEYTIELKKHCKSIALIELKNQQGEIINADMLKKVDSSQFQKELFKICYNLAIEEVFDNHLEDFVNFLKEMGFQISVDGTIL